MAKVFSVFLVILFLAGCVVKPAVPEGSSLHDLQEQPHITSSKMELFVFPRQSTEPIESGYFVEFDLDSRAGVGAVKYKDN